MWLRRGDQGRPAQAATVPLRKEWHLSHFNSWSCFRQGWGLLEKLPLHANLIFLFFFSVLSQCASCCYIGGQLSKGLCRRIRLIGGSGDWIRGAGPQWHTSCCRDTGVPVRGPFLCHIFFHFLQVYQFGWLNTRATLRDPTSGCGLAKAFRLLASNCWFSTPLHCSHDYSSPHCGLQYGEWRMAAQQEWN